TRLRRSGLTCCTPSAASAFVGGSTKSALEALHPVPPSLRWEAHRGSPVSTLCALDKTPLVVTASTDSTIRLFSLADVQEPGGGAADLGRHGDTGNQNSLCPGRGNHGSVHGAYCAPDDRFTGVVAAPVAAAPSTQLGAVTTKKNLAGGGKSGMGDRDCQKLIDGNAADLGFRKPSATELGSTAAKPARGEPAADKAGIVGHSGEGPARTGSGSLWDRGQSPSDSFDKQRMTLTSARAAKNHLGKVLYGNMYHEIKSGTACNTLVMEYVHRKNPRGDAVIDTEVSPFLKENLTDSLPSLAERRRRRRRQATGAAKASNPVNGASASAKSTGGRDTLQSYSWSQTGGGTNTGTSAKTDEAREMLGITRSTGEGRSAGETSGPDIAENQEQTQQTLEEWHGHPRTDTDRLLNSDSGVNNSDDNAGKRVQRRPRYKSPVSSGSNKRNIGNRAAPTDEDHTESRRSVRGTEPQHVHAESPILAAGRNRAPIKQEDAHYQQGGNRF
ncbi:unnamed protein product, partial [Ectocarpus sp. 8 AP-2014]